MSALTNKPFINIAYEMNNIRVYYIEHQFFAYCVDAENIIPIVDKRAKKIANEVVKRTDGAHITNLTYAFPNTFKDSTKDKIRNLCKNTFLDKNVMLKMLLLLIV